MGTNCLTVGALYERPRGRRPRYGSGRILHGSGDLCCIRLRLDKRQIEQKAQNNPQTLLPPFVPIVKTKHVEVARYRLIRGAYICLCVGF